MENLKEYIVKNYGSRLKEPIHNEIMMSLIGQNIHVSYGEVDSCINEILNPLPPIEDELNTMNVTQLNEVIDTYKLEVDKSLIKSEKLYSIKVLFGYIVEPIKEEI